MPPDERNLWWRIGVMLFRPIETALFRVHVQGARNIPQGPGIIAFNHVSILDGPCLAIETSLRGRRELRFLIAAELFKVFFFGWVIRLFDQIPIHRGQGDDAALDEAIETVRAGSLAAIAPEGRVNDDPSSGLLRIRSGVARIAIPTGALVIPVGVWGTQKRWPKSGPNLAKLWQRKTLAIVYGEALKAEESETIDTFRERLRTALEAAVERAKAGSLS